jgi:hypothetical protein
MTLFKKSIARIGRDEWDAQVFVEAFTMTGHRVISVCNQTEDGGYLIFAVKDDGVNPDEVDQKYKDLKLG